MTDRPDPADPPGDESARLAALESTGLLDAGNVMAFDAITDLLAVACGVPIALVTLVDEHRQYFSSHRGLEVTETPRDQAFCARAIEQPDEIMVVEDSHADERFVDNALVTGPPHIRFYAGKPVRAASGHALGTVCIIDRTPRQLTDREAELLHHAARQVEGLIAASTERRRLASRAAALVAENAELEQAIADRAEFLAVAKHKLKTPLAVVAGWATTLGQFDLLSPDERAAGLDAIERAAGELRAQIDDLLDEARIHLRGQALHPEAIDLHGFVTTVTDDLRIDGDRHPVRVDVPSTTVVHADREALRHIVAHLVDNAIKYSPDGGAITVAARRLDDDVALTVSDRGIGLPDGDDDLFEPFHRGTNASAVARGTGLGLHIVRLLSSSLGGSVRAYGNEGGGATVEVVLPAGEPVS